MAAPINDNFAARTILPSATSVVSFGTTVDSTGEAGEPPANGILNSIWYSWTAPSSGLTNITTIGSDYATNLGVFTGNTVNSLALVGSNDFISFAFGPTASVPVFLASNVGFNAVAGTTYQIQVDGNSAGTGNARLAISTGTLSRSLPNGSISLGTSFADVIFGDVGANLNDTIASFAGDDLVFGGNGNDSIDGGAGNDSLYGDNGNDVLIGNLGNDSLVGGPNADTLIGGLGNDAFTYFSRTEGSDTIADFTVGSDSINVVLNGLGGNSFTGVGLVAGNIPAIQFLSGAGVTTANTVDQRFIYDTSSGILRFDVDGSNAVFTPSILATLTGAPALTRFDIVAAPF
jgi:Ca2+-binding RTX toxin-like protein